ncbi:26S proteasome non-ATPase regulatory subunit 11 [Anabrus simplex]|uniref:26S proteasome non-ATPase regulatory subunit 11 n=1 Tax=Anabrus simplex TaxID=316456 RepID=UPI0035A2907C
MAGALLVDSPNYSAVSDNYLSNGTLGDKDDIRDRELLILRLGEQYKREGKTKELSQLIKDSKPFLSLISKAKAAKLVRTLLGLYLTSSANPEAKVLLCNECIDWAKSEKIIFLQHFLETQLIVLYNEAGMFSNALALSTTLLQHLKKLEDKHLVVEVQLSESKTFYALSNLPRALASLTSARAAANGIYCPPELQAALDMQSGIIHAAHDQDFKTAFSYFCEALEVYNSIENPKALIALKYMLLSKIMLNDPGDIHHLLNTKLTLKYTGRDIEAMKSVAEATRKRSLAAFQLSLETYKDELENDEVIRTHLKTLYEDMLTHNLCRIIEPYSRVQVSYISEAINLSAHEVEKKLSQMILDKRFNGILDQGSGVLISFPEKPVDRNYDATLPIVQSMLKVVETLYQKALKI